MAVGIRARTRLAAGVVASAALVVTTSLVSAHGGDPTVAHACVVTSSGQIRIVDPGATCRAGEVALDWSLGGAALEPGSVTGEADNDPATTPTGELALRTVGRANLVDGAVDATKLSATFLSSLVTDLELGSLVATLVTDLELTAALDALLPITSINIADNAVTGSKIENGTVTAADLAGSDGDSIVPGSVTSEKILDGTVQARDIGDNAVTGSEVANGSLSPDDTTANAGYTVASGSTAIAVGQVERLGLVTLTVTGGVHKVLVTGSAVVDCTACTSELDSTTVEWTLVDGDVPVVGHSGAVTLSSVDRMATLPVSFLVEDAAAGTHSYRLELSVLDGGTDDVTASSVSLVAVDLGRAPAP